MKPIRNTKPNCKRIILSPYQKTWPIVDDENTVKVLQDLKCIIEPLNIKLEYVSTNNHARINKRRKISNQKSSSPPENNEFNSSGSMNEDLCTDKKDSKHNIEVKEKDEVLKEELQAQRKRRKKLLSIGINCVTKSLERDQLKLLFVDRSTVSMITKHLINLSAFKKCPTACIHGLSEKVKTLLGMPCAAIGFNKACELMSTEVEKLSLFVSNVIPADDENCLNFQLKDDSEPNTVHEPCSEDDTLIFDEAETRNEKDGSEKSNECMENSSPIILDYNSLDYSNFYVLKGESNFIFDKFVTGDYLSTFYRSSNNTQLTVNNDLDKLKSKIIEKVNSSEKLKPTYISTTVGIVKPNPDRKRNILS